MKTGSLRLRLLLASTAAVAVALAIAGIGLVLLFERHVERRIGVELDTYLNQMAARVVLNEDGSFALQGTLADPRFDKIFSGLYWQIADETTNSYARSRSLWDTKLDPPQDMPAVGVIHIHDIPGPQDSQLLLHERRLAFAAPPGERILRLAVAIDRADVNAITIDFAWDVGLSLLLLFAVLIAAAWAQVNLGLRPLNVIREGLAGISDGKTDRLLIDVPGEIAPLVSEVNSLLEAQEKSMRRARDRAADLAHGFKTPLTALLADAKRLRKKGQFKIASEIEQTAETMRGHIERELTRSRMRNVSKTHPIKAGPVIQSLVETLKRTPEGEPLSFETEIKADVCVRADRDDLNEVLGNLLENAVRHAKKMVRVSAVNDGTVVKFSVEDDGPGISDDQIGKVLRRGQRLDQAPLSAGLGLAIVSDILNHYGQSLTFERSDLGGLKASFTMNY